MQRLFPRNAGSLRKAWCCNFLLCGGSGCHGGFIQLVPSRKIKIIQQGTETVSANESRYSWHELNSSSNQDGNENQGEVSRKSTSKIKSISRCPWHELNSSSNQDGNGTKERCLERARPRSNPYLDVPGMNSTVHPIRTAMEPRRGVSKEHVQDQIHISMSLA